MTGISKHLKAVFFIVFLLGALAVALYLSQQRYIRPQATPGQPDLSFYVSPAITANNNFDLIIQVTPNGAAFYAYEFVFNFDQSKVSLQDTTTTENNFLKSQDTTVMYSSVAGNTITISGAKTNSPYPSSGTYELVRVKMKALPTATGIVNFTWDNSSTIADSQTNKANGVFTVGTGGTTITTTQAPTQPIPTTSTTPPQNGASLFFSSPKTNYNLGENLDLVLNLNTAGNSVTSVNFLFSYNDAALEFQNTTGDLALNIIVDPNSGFDTANALKNVDAQNKTVRLGLPTGIKPAVSGTKQLATVKFKVKAATTLTNASFVTDQNASLIYNTQSQNILSQTPSYQITIGSGTPTSTGQPGSCSAGQLRCNGTLIENCVNQNWARYMDCADYGKTCNMTNPNQPVCVSTNVVKVGSITFRAKTGVTGNAPIDFSLTQESFVSESGGGDILGQITGLIIKILSSGTPTPTPDPNAPYIAFVVKFRSVSDQSGQSNPQQKVTLRVKGNGIFKEYKNITVNHLINGVYYTPNPINLSGISSLEGLTFFVKGPKHLAKEMDNTAILLPAQITEQGLTTDFQPTVYYGWNGRELEGGDTIPQDGIVNSVDISRILDLLEVANQQQAQLDVGDLNYDGIVNGADVNELILTLSNKRDED